MDGIDLKAGTHEGFQVWVQHDGDLADVVTQMRAERISVGEGSGALEDDLPRNCGVLIATPTRILESRSSALDQAPPCIAVIRDESRMLCAHLKRLGVRLIVRRPFHPKALLLLVLHELYAGPERRRRGRVSVGAPIRLRRGLFSRKATLLDLSTSGCRIASRRELADDARVKVVLPEALTGEMPLTIEARVVRRDEEEAPGDPDGFVTVLAFVGSHSGRRRVIERIQSAHRAGIATHPDGVRQFEPTPRRRAPARIEASEPSASMPRSIEAPATAMPPEPSGAEDEAMLVGPAPIREASGGAPDPSPLAPRAEDDPVLPDDGLEAEGEMITAEEAIDRRTDSRHVYPRRVVALADSGTRVLVGRDISPRGMRVEPTSRLAIGESFRVAIHAGVRREPLIVSARVERDDDDLGLLLRFDDLGAASRIGIEKLLAELPPISDGMCDDDEAPIVVGEILPPE